MKTYILVIVGFLAIGFLSYKVYRLNKLVNTDTMVINQLLTGAKPTIKDANGKEIELIPRFVDILTNLNDRLTKLEAKK